MALLLCLSLFRVTAYPKPLIRLLRCYFTVQLRTYVYRFYKCKVETADSLKITEIVYPCWFWILHQLGIVLTMSFGEKERKKERGMGKDCPNLLWSSPIVSAGKTCHLHSKFLWRNCSLLQVRAHLHIYVQAGQLGHCSAVESSCADVPGCSCNCGCSTCSVQFMANCSVVGSSTHFNACNATAIHFAICTCDTLFSWSPGIS